jgi:uncharacterized iron-regulated protein
MQRHSFRSVDMTKRILNPTLVALIVFSAGLPLLAQADNDKSLTLNIGDKRFRDRTLEIEAGRVYSAETGGPVTLDRLARELAPCRYVYIGETHNSLPVHDVQLAVLKALYEKDRNVCLGLEMYPVTFEEPLAKWGLGLLTDDAFVAEGWWYVNWNFNFGYYKKIFDFAKDMKLPVHGLNVPREIITRVRMAGWDALSEDQKKLVPPLDLSNQEHRKLIRTVFESAELPSQMKGAGLDMVFEGLYRGQVAWDTVMAANARRAAQVENRTVVVLAGSGHLLYKLGINMRVAERDKAPAKTIICVAVPEGAKSLKVSRSLADFIWGLPEEKRPAYPDIGLAFKTFAGLDNLVVERKPMDGAAAAADFDKGDIILSVDGRSFGDINALRTYLAGFAWDQEVKFRTLRAGVEKDVVLKLVQPPPTEPKDK